MVNFINISAARTFPSIPPALPLCHFDLFLALCVSVFQRKNCWESDFWPNMSVLFHNFLACYRCHSSCSMMQVIDQYLFPSKRADTDYQRTSRFSGSNDKVCFCREARLQKCDKINKSALGSSGWSRVLSLVSQTREASMHHGPI